MKTYFLILTIFFSIFLIGCEDKEERLERIKNAEVKKIIITSNASSIDLSKITNQQIVGLCIIEYVADLKNIKILTDGTFEPGDIEKSPGDQSVSLIFWSNKSDRWQIILNSNEFGVDGNKIGLTAKNYCFRKNQLSISRVKSPKETPIITEVN